MVKQNAVGMIGPYYKTPFETPVSPQDVLYAVNFSDFDVGITNDIW
jgi:hypothetical protein